jgi:nucleotide-binding universal stress UspA family protein
MKIKHILITSDLSKESLRPFVPVLELAEQLGARVTLLHVVHELMAVPHGAAFAPMVTSANLGEHLKTASQGLAEQCADLGTSVELNHDVISSPDVALGVVQYAQQHDVDLIALSTHGRTGWKHLLLGSIAESILQYSDIPVLSFQRTQ